jgi:predicted ATPase/class 3 adenylate cyclase
MDLPTGIVTFLFTDIEGSTRLWEKNPAEMTIALARHEALVREAAVAHSGHVFKTVGDAFCIVFANPADAVGAAVDAQRALIREQWATPTPIVVRMAAHTGSSEARNGDYLGPPVNRVARLLSIAHGKQILISRATATIVGQSLPTDISLTDRGSHRLKDLQDAEKVFQVVHPDLPTNFPPLRSLSTHPNNLPQQTTRFIGRERELPEVKQLLSTTRLLTVTGPGGAGKTRLTLQFTADVLESFEEGVWFVELAPVADATLVPQAVAATLEVREGPAVDLRSKLIEHLATKRILLVLDNCEHVLDACARLANDFLRHCPHLKIVASSRERLGVPGELTYRVPSLSMPDRARDLPPERLSAYEAVALFVDRAQSHVPAFAVSRENASALASICLRLDGIPFAIELAAARVRTLTVQQLNERLVERLDLLTGGSRTALPRQQTLRSLIDWSYDLLAAGDRTLLGRCAVFVGGWTLEAATAVCSGDGIEERDVLDLLTSLADKSLVVADEHGGAMRYRMLEMVRQYARDRLSANGEEPRLRDKHSAHFVALAEEASGRLRSADPEASLDRLDTEHDNLRAALTHAIGSGGDGTDALRLAGAMWRFWLTRGHLSEGRGHLSAVLAADTPAAPPGVRARALVGAGILAYEQGDFEAARPLWHEAMTIYERADDQSGVSRAVDALANLAYIQGDYETARPLYERSIEIGRRLRNASIIASSLSNLGVLAGAQGDFEAARRLHEESLAMARKLGDRKGIAVSLTNLGSVLAEQGNLASAQRLLEDCAAICDQIGDPVGTAAAQLYLGNVAFERGEWKEAIRLHEQCLSTRWQLGDRHGVAESLEALAAVNIPLGRTMTAVTLWGQAERLRADLRSPVPPGERDRYDRAVAGARARAINEAEFDEAWRKGGEMSVADAVALALHHD